MHDALHLCTSPTAKSGTEAAIASLQNPAGISPWEFAAIAPSAPVLSSAEHGWRNLTVQRYRMPPSSFSVPPARDHRVVVHLAGPTLVETDRGGGRRDRGWSDSGHVRFIPAGVPASYVLKGRPDLVLMHISCALVDEVAQEICERDPARISLVQDFGRADRALDSIGRLLLAEAEARAPGGRLLADAMARALAVHLLRRYSSLAPRAPDAPAAMPAGRLKRVVEHMRSNLAEDLPLTRLAAVGGLSPSHFARAFREAIGEPPHRYLMGLRVERARDLLERTALPIIEIGMRCGFGQANHFSTTFGRLTGMSPRAYRNARRG